MPVIVVFILALAIMAVVIGVCVFHSGRDNSLELRNKAKRVAAVYHALGEHLHPSAGQGSWENKPAIVTIYNFLRGSGVNYAVLSPRLKKDYANLVQDCINLRQALPCDAMLRKLPDHPDGRTFGGSYVVTQFQANGCYDPRIFEPWMEKAKELSDLIEEFRSDATNDVAARGEKLLNQGFSYHGSSSSNAPYISERGLGEKDLKVVREISASLDSMPLLEAERAKRALGTIAEAQRLRSKIDSPDITIGGKSPDEVVEEIVSRSVRQLSQVQDDPANPQEELEVLYIYSRSLE